MSPNPINHGKYTIIYKYANNLFIFTRLHIICSLFIVKLRSQDNHPSKHKTFVEFWCNVSPTFSTLVQHWINVIQHCINVIEMFCVYWDVFCQFKTKSSNTASLKSEQLLLTVFASQCWHKLSLPRHRQYPRLRKQVRILRTNGVIIPP